jgi:5-formyltetrahydrofolate cyclo-ligase
MDASLMPDKAALRRAALARRDALEIDDRLEWDQAIAEQALALDLWGKGPVAAYWPIRSEADPRPILEGLAMPGLPLCLPVVVDGSLVFRSWRPWEPVVPGGYGTLVPPETAPLIIPAILVMPLAAFDRRCHRIGYGKGHYDRALAGLPGARTIGIAYGVQEVPAIPEEPHDHCLDLIVTEREVIRAGHSLSAS